MTKPQILFLTFLHPRTFIQPIFSCTSVSSVGLADGRGVVLLHRGRPLRRGLRRAAFCAVVYAAVLSLLLQPMPPGLPLDLAYLSCPLLRSSLVLRSLYLTQSYLLPAPLYSTAASGTSASGTINTWFSSAASNLQAIRWGAVDVRTQILL